MKLVSKVILCIAVVALFLVGSTQLDARPKTQDPDGWLLIPCTVEEPDIDGVLDDVWKCVTATRMDSLEAGGIDTTETGELLDGTQIPFADHFTRFRAMWDEDNFYVFIEVVDDSIATPLSDPWNNDNVELFFDGDNSKNPQATGYDANDFQWRWVFEDAANAGPEGNVYAWAVTPEGYNLEIAIPADVIPFDLDGDVEIGFEVSNADNDGGNRERVNHWWTSNGNCWNNPSLFGNAVLLSPDVREVESVMDIHFTDEEPVIDGVMDEDDGWYAEDVGEFSDNEVEGGAARDTILTTSVDKQISFRTMWNDDALYIFVKSYDDIINVDAADPWNDDCIEIFIDGDNSKNPQATGYDANDFQWRWVYDDAAVAGPEGSVCAWLRTDQGWNFELELPADVLPFELVEEHEFGFELSSNDNDEGVRSLVRHWWTSNEFAWNNPSVFGTAVLLGGGTAVKPTPSVAKEFNLSQNYPNPFNPTTRINFSVEQEELVRLSVYNTLGEVVKTLHYDITAPGSYDVEFDGSALPSGLYIYKLESKSGDISKKMILLK